MKKITSFLLSAVLTGSVSASALPTFFVEWTQPMARTDGSIMLCEDLKQFNIYVKKPAATSYVIAYSLNPIPCPNSGRWAIEFQPEQPGTYSFTGTTKTKDGAVSTKALRVTKTVNGPSPGPLILNLPLAPASPAF